MSPAPPPALAVVSMAGPELTAAGVPTAGVPTAGVLTAGVSATAAGVPLTRPVGDLLSSALAICAPGVSIREAARVMAAANTGAVLAVGANGQPLGILTDADLRRRVVAADVDPAAPLAQVMSAPLVVVPRETLAVEALQVMLEHGIHHLVVADGAGRALGVLAADDLLAAEAEQPLLLARRIERAQGIADLAAVHAAYPTAARLLLDGGAQGDVVGRVLAETNDHLTRRLLALAEAALGPPPAAYCWLSMGSEGRREQTLLTDQDHGLLWADEAPPGADEYFARLATWVVGALEACGVPRCRGGVMATNPRWRGPATAWRARVRGWIEAPEPRALLDALIGLDFRPVVGAVDLGADLRAWLTRYVPGQRRFLAHLARDAMDKRLPLGLLGRFAVDRRGEHAGAFDAKHRAVGPLADAARVLALALGVPATDTLGRLAGAQAAGALSEEEVVDLRAAFITLQELRLRRQLAALAQGRPPDNAVVPRALPRAERARLREHLAAIQRLQGAVGDRYALALRGL